MARRFGEMLEGKVAYLNKTRPSHDSAAATEVIGDVIGKIAIMSDDMIVTGGTLLAGAKALKAAGADGGLRLRDPRALPAGSAAKARRQRDRAHRRHRHRSGQPARATGEAADPDRVAGSSPSRSATSSRDESVSAIFAGENQLF